jgi:transcription elongation GreA/GreB family factor
MRENTATETARASVGSAVTIEISTGPKAPPRLARWTLADATDRARRRLDVNSALGRVLIGARVDDEYTVAPEGGESFDVVVLGIN